jgi:hypothetical protein
MRDLGDLTVSNPALGTYYFQVCSEVVSHCGSAEASVCLKDKKVAINAGSTSGAVWQDRIGKEDEGVIVIYSNGDVCGKDGSKRKTIVQLQCYLHGNPHHKRDIDPFSVSSYISFLEQSDSCTTRLTVFTPFACAKNKKYTTVCNAQKTKEHCFGVGSCECSWCGDKCLSSFEKCEGHAREMQCDVEERPMRFGTMLVVLFTTVPLLALLMCMCCCTCFRRRQIKHQLDSKLRLPVATRRNNIQEDIALEPLLMDQSAVPQPQYILVQYPMPTGQQHPPLFAPNPMFVVPQYAQPQV